MKHSRGKNLLPSQGFEPTTFFDPTNDSQYILGHRQHDLGCNYFVYETTLPGLSDGVSWIYKELSGLCISSIVTNAAT